MRFWIKIGFLGFLGYLGCYGSMLFQDRRQHHEIVREVEAATRNVALFDCVHGDNAAARAKLEEVKIRLAADDAKWRQDASRLMILSDDR